MHATPFIEQGQEERAAKRREFLKAKNMQSYYSFVDEHANWEFTTEQRFAQIFYEKLDVEPGVF